MSDNQLLDGEELSPSSDLLSKEEHYLLNVNKKRLTYQHGENLFKQGAFAPYVMYIIDGLVKVYLQTGPDKQINIRLARAGDYLAFSTVFEQSVYSYSTVALKNSTVCMIDKKSLSEVLLTNPEFAMRITSRNANHQLQLLEIIKNISYKQMRGKLASALIYLSTDAFLQEEVFQYLTRHDIADFAAISTESAIKFLKEFEKEGIIALDGKNITIVDAKKLTILSEHG